MNFYKQLKKSVIAITLSLSFIAAYLPTNMVYAASGSDYAITQTITKLQDTSTLSIGTLEKASSGSEVSVSITYKGLDTYTLKISDAAGNDIPFKLVGTDATFQMPSSNVTITATETLYSDDENTTNTDSIKDVGDISDLVAGNKGNNAPDVSNLAQVSKKAAWVDIFKGSAKVSLSEKDLSFYETSNSDYIFVLDLTSSMSSTSPCMESGHYYKCPDGNNVLLYSWRNGVYMDNCSDGGGTTRTAGEPYSYKNNFATLADAQKYFIEHHYYKSSSGVETIITNSDSSSICTDRLTLVKNSMNKMIDSISSSSPNSSVYFWGFSGDSALPSKMLTHNQYGWSSGADAWSNLKTNINSLVVKNTVGTFYGPNADSIETALKEKKANGDLDPTKVIFISDGYPNDDIYLKDDYKTHWENLKTSIDSNNLNASIFTVGIGIDSNTQTATPLKLIASSSKYSQFLSCSLKASFQSLLNGMLTNIYNAKTEVTALNKTFVEKISDKFVFDGFTGPDTSDVTEITYDDGSKAKYDDATKTITWSISSGSDIDNNITYYTKLNEQYRYTPFDGEYPVDTDTEFTYTVSSGNNRGEIKSIPLNALNLHYGVANITAKKNWSIEGSKDTAVTATLVSVQTNADTSQTITYANSATLNEENGWTNKFTKMSEDNQSYPLLLYGNSKDTTFEYNVIEKTTDIPYFYNYDGNTYTGDKIDSTVTLTNTPYRANVQITKVDKETGKRLSGAIFTVYQYDSKSDTYLPYTGTETSISSDNVMILNEIQTGVYASPTWLYFTKENKGKFRLVETQAPVGYYGDWKNLPTIAATDEGKNIYNIAITENNTTIIVSTDTYSKELVTTNERVLGKVILTSKDSDSLMASPQGLSSFVGAKYELYAASNIIHQDKQTTNINYINDGIPGLLYKKGDLVRTAQTDESGCIAFDNLELGEYYIRQTGASNGYLINTSDINVTISYKDEAVKKVEVPVDAFVTVKRAKQSFYSIDDKTTIKAPLWGADYGFSIYAVNDLAIADADKLTDDELVQSVIDKNRNVSTLEYNMSGIPTALIGSKKTDSDVTSGKLSRSYTDKSGNVYMQTDDTTSMYYIQELHPVNGIVTTSRLPYGKYMIVNTSTVGGKKPIKPFILNITSDDKNGDTISDGKGTSLTPISFVINKVESYIKIVNFDAKTSQPILKEGAAYVIHDKDSAWYDKYMGEATSVEKNNYSKLYGDLVVQNSKGTYVGTYENPFVTSKVGEDGIYTLTAQPLPIGEYILEEVTALNGYVKQGKEGTIRVKSLSGKSFYEDEKTAEWQNTPSEQVHFVVGQSESTYDATSDTYTQTVKQYSSSATGKLSILAEGEVLDSVSTTQVTNTNLVIDVKNSIKTAFNKLFENDNTSFDNSMPVKATDMANTTATLKDVSTSTLSEAAVYEKLNAASISYSKHTFNYQNAPLKGVVYKITARDNIYSQEGDKNCSLLYAKGTVVKTLTTDAEGKCWTEALPLGSYTITCTKVPKGFYLSDDYKKQDFDITYAGQEVPITYKSVANVHPRTKLNTNISNVSNSKLPLKNAIVGLYCKDNIANSVGKIVVTAGSLVDVAWSKEGTDGTIYDAQFKNDVPLGNYYVQELVPPAGYIKSTATIDINGNYVNSNDPYITLHDTVTNNGISVYVSTLSSDKESELTSAAYEVYDKYGTKVYSFESTGTKFLINQKLDMGETYTLHQISAATGYAIASDVKFKVEERKDSDTSDWQTVKVIVEPITVNILTLGVDNLSNKTITAANNTLSKSISVKNATSIATIGESSVTGATPSTLETIEGVVGHLEDAATRKIVTLSNGTTTTECKWTTSKEMAETIAKLPAGNYFIIIESAPNGYVYQKESKITVAENGVVQNFPVYITPTKVTLNTYLETDGQKNKRFGNVEVTITKSDGSNVSTTDTDGTKLKASSFTSSSKKSAVLNNLTEGSYKAIITSTPDGYYAPNKTVDFTIKKGMENTQVDLYIRSNANHTTTDTNKTSTTENNTLTTAQKSSNVSEKVTNPKTGDNTTILPFLIIIGVSIFSMVGVGLYMKKRRKDANES